MSLQKIDLNADLGEIPGDLAMMPVVSSANIACGGHAGDAGSMRQAVETALRHGVAIGAHPGYPDKAGFGRRDLDMTAAAVGDAVAEQIAALCHIAGDLGGAVEHFKLHGALYHRAGRDQSCAEAIVDSVSRATPGVSVVLAQHGALAVAAQAFGWRVAFEAFCDRAYDPSGELADRRNVGAVLTDPEAVVAQALSIATTRCVTTTDGSALAVKADSLCVHGDTPGALELATRVREALEAAGLAVTALGR